MIILAYFIGVIALVYTHCWRVLGRHWLQLSAESSLRTGTRLAHFHCHGNVPDLSDELII